MFSALDSEKAAETLMEAEPRAQRQIMANLRQERAMAIMSEMSAAQLADLFSVLPLEDRDELMALLPKAQAERTTAILAEHDATAASLMSGTFLKMPQETTVADALSQLRASGLDHAGVSYVYVTVADALAQPAGNLLLGVVDLRELVMTADDKVLRDIMVSPVVSVDENIVKDDIAQMFAKYHFRMLPVVDAKDHLLGVIHYNDIMKGLVTRAQI